MYERYFQLLRIIRWIDALRKPKANPWRAVFLRHAVFGVMSDE